MTEEREPYDAIQSVTGATGVLEAMNRALLATCDPASDAAQLRELCEVQTRKLREQREEIARLRAGIDAALKEIDGEIAAFARSEALPIRRAIKHGLTLAYGIVTRHTELGGGA